MADDTQSAPVLTGKTKLEKHASQKNEPQKSESKMPADVSPIFRDGVQASLDFGADTKHDASGSVTFGPEREAVPFNYGHHTNYNYLKGYSKKILKDLIKTARMYNGQHASIYKVAGGERCTKCTNLVTGERLLTNCPVCHGTGFLKNWEYLGDFWTLVDFGPGYRIATPLGNTENPNGTKEQIIILGAPILEDQALIIFEETQEVFKIYDVEPHIVAMRGDVIAQIASAAAVTYGSEEYKLTKWRKPGQEPVRPVDGR